MNKFQELMAITTEECGELTQVCMKQMRKFSNKKQSLAQSEDALKWRNKLVEELGDVQCMIDLLVEHGMVDAQEIAHRVKVKRDKLKLWSKLVD